jgi:uncharacterized damage-inducible protein DinB
MTAELITLVEIFRYGQEMNVKLLDAADRLTAAQLDEPLDIGPGSVRKICTHLLHGEATWLKRFTGNPQAPWPTQPQPLTPAQMVKQLSEIHTERAAFVDGLGPAQLSNRLSYRDSRGSMFTATLHQMLIQSVLHSHHHRAQMINAIRRVGVPIIEADYMYSVRQPE